MNQMLSPSATPSVSIFVGLLALDASVLLKLLLSLHQSLYILMYAVITFSEVTLHKAEKK